MQNPFITNERLDGSLYYTLDPNAPEWVLDTVREMHDDELPNDWRWDVAAALWDTLDDGAFHDAWESAQFVTDRYTAAEAARWLSEYGSRIAYLDEWVERFGNLDGHPETGGQLLLGAMFMAVHNMADILIDAFAAHHVSA